jgi:hypothetical protein
LSAKLETITLVAFLLAELASADILLALDVSISTSFGAGRLNEQR